MKNRHFLFLQGVASPFFDQLADALIAAQQQVDKIHFCGGDNFYWKHKKAWHFNAPIHQLDAFIAEKFCQEQFTDIILFGDMRPIHRPAIAIAKKYQAKIWVFEEGYLRPHWLTLEENGVNGNSSLSKIPDDYLLQSQQIPIYQNGLDTDYSILIRLWRDILYNFARYLFSYRYPHYQLHRPQSALREYWGWITRFPIQKIVGDYFATKIHKQLLKNNSSFFLFPLQLHYDAQIIYHSPFKTIEDAISLVLESFAQYADKKDVLVIKNHPLDIGIINYRKLIQQKQKQLKLENRVFFINGGNLELFLKDCKGTVTINSTVGISALQNNSPVISLGKAIYNIAGLTFQGSLDNFWTQAQSPDKKLFENFRNTVIHQTQINGNFYTEKGIAMAVENSLQRILFANVKKSAKVKPFRS
jgi:capsular polysaccharide export protein